MTTHRVSIPILLASLVLILSVGDAGAQWLSQSLSLRPGWNAVFLEVRPQPDDSDSVFDGVPIESVWAWNPTSASVQFIDDPDELVLENPEWLAYFPPTTLASLGTNLHIIQGGKPYLINLGGTEPYEWVVRGRPVLRPIRWKSDSYNFVGFHLAEGDGPLFASYFAASPAHAGQSIFQLDGAGDWVPISDPASARMRGSEAYWIYTKGESKYQGPVRITFDQGTGLDFSNTLTEQRLRLKNETSVDQVYTIEAQDSEEPADPNAPALAGGVPLSYWKQDFASADVGWQALEDAITVTVPAGEEYILRLAVRRADMAAYAPKDGEGDYLYQGLLALRTLSGTPIMMPVTSHGAVLPGVGAEVHARAGLWVGSAAINAVSDLHRPRLPGGEGEGEDGGDGELAPTPSEFQFALIVHVDSDGTARLLRQVTQLWQEGTYQSDPDDPERQIVDEPGRYVLVTDNEHLDEFTGATLRDGVPVGRRVSSPIFGFREPITMDGEFPTVDQPGTTVTCLVDIDYDDPRNPFKHKYHPDHDNLSAGTSPVLLPEGKESYSVTREITLEFSATPPENLTTAGWGDTQLGGTYRESVGGLYERLERNEIEVEGTFRLRRVCTVPELIPNPEA